MSKIDDTVVKFTEDIEFPNSCVICGKESPDSTIPLSPPEENGNGNGNGDARMDVYAVPACQDCAYSLKSRDRQISTLSFTLFVLLFTILGTIILRSFASLIFIALALFLIAFFSSLGALKVGRQFISISDINTSTITFAFKSQKYRDEFVKLNGSLEIE